MVPVFNEEDVPVHMVLRDVELREQELASIQGSIDSSFSGSSFMQAKIKAAREERQAAILNWKQLLRWLPEGQIAFEVPLDGDCGPHTFLSASTGSCPDFQDPAVKGQVSGLRQELSNAWKQVCTIDMWVHIHHLVGVKYPGHVCGQADNFVSAASTSSMKREATTPPKRKKPEAPVFIDLCTPEKKVEQIKPNGRKKRPVVAVGAQASSLSRPEADTQPELVASQGEERKRRFKCLKGQMEYVLQGMDDEAQGRDKPSAQKEKQGEEEEEQQRRKRVRTCKKKEKTEKDLEIDAANLYLSSLGVTYMNSQAYHYRVPGFLRERCKEFAMLAETLLADQSPDCPLCCALLRDRGYKAEDFKAHMDKALKECGPASPATERLRKYGRALGSTGPDVHEDQQPVGLETDFDVPPLMDDPDRGQTELVYMFCLRSFHAASKAVFLRFFHVFSCVFLIFPHHHLPPHPHHHCRFQSSCAFQKQTRNIVYFRDLSGLWNASLTKIFWSCEFV